VLTVFSAAILIGAEVFGAAFAGGWAVASYLDLGPYGVHIMQGIFFACGIAVMVAFIRKRPARRGRSPPAADGTLARSGARPAPRPTSATKKNLVKWVDIAYVRNCPISHVPVAVCRSVGIRTRGRTAARSKIADAEYCDRLSSEST